MTIPIEHSYNQFTKSCADIVGARPSLHKKYFCEGELRNKNIFKRVFSILKNWLVSLSLSKTEKTNVAKFRAKVLVFENVKWLENTLAKPQLDLAKKQPEIKLTLEQVLTALRVMNKITQQLPPQFASDCSMWLDKKKGDLLSAMGDKVDAVYGSPYYHLMPKKIDPLLIKLDNPDTLSEKDKKKLETCTRFKNLIDFDPDAKLSKTNLLVRNLIQKIDEKEITFERKPGCEECAKIKEQQEAELVAAANRGRRFKLFNRYFTITKALRQDPSVKVVIPAVETVAEEHLEEPGTEPLAVAETAQV